jgi:hypothetical protein
MSTTQPDTQNFDLQATGTEIMALLLHIKHVTVLTQKTESIITIPLPSLSSY